MAIKQANKYTDKNRPSGYYMVNGKRRYWSAENKKYYLEQIGSTDDTMARLGIPNPGGYIKGLIKGDPEKRRKADLMIAIGERGGRGMQLPAGYRESELRAETEGRRSLGQSANIPLNENEVPAIKRNRELKMLTEAEATQQPEAAVTPAQGAATAQAAATTPTQQLVAKSRPMNTTETIAAGKNPLHVWALANAKMIRRNQNARQLQILDEAESASKPKKTSAEKVGWQGRTGMY